MNVPRTLRSPLVGTLLVLLLMAALAVPLVRLTWRKQTKETSSLKPNSTLSESGVAAGLTTPAVVRLKFLAPVVVCRLRDDSGKVFLELHEVSAGESEHDVVLPWRAGEVEVTLEAEFRGLVGETAVFVTMMPDGREDRTAYATGASPIQENLRFRWDG